MTELPADSKIGLAATRKDMAEANKPQGLLERNTALTLAIPKFSIVGIL
jgi:hypothetical protein